LARTPSLLCSHTRPLRPPLPPLLPYTTLFRSSARDRRPPALRTTFRTARSTRRQRAPPRGGPRRREPGSTTCRPSPPTTAARPSDRKSTRLNSSHQIISYAVFCLKKNKYASHN